MHHLGPLQMIIVSLCAALYLVLHSDSPVHAWPLAFQFDVIYMQEVADGSSQSISETVLTSAEQQGDKALPFKTHFLFCRTS